MRQKDALTNENAVLNKLAERQQQKIEAANELQRSLAQQVVCRLIRLRARHARTDLLLIITPDCCGEGNLSASGKRARLPGDDQHSQT